MKLIIMAQNQRKGRNYSDSNKSSEQIFVFRLKAGKHMDGLGCNLFHRRFVDRGQKLFRPITERVSMQNKYQIKLV